MKFKESILIKDMSIWKPYEGAQLVNGRIQLPVGGYATAMVAPKSKEEKAMPEAYRIDVHYEVPVNKMVDKMEICLEVKFKHEDDKSTVTNVLLPLHPNEDGTVGSYLITCKGGINELLTFTMRNISYKGTVMVKSLQVHPSYDIDDATYAEIEQHLPTVLHVANTRQYVVTNEMVEVLSIDASTSSTSNLLVHLLAIGRAEKDTDVTFELKLDGEQLPYSPMKQSIKSGYFAIGIPANVMAVDAGKNTLTVGMSSSNGYLYIDPDKLQCTIDGKNMLSNTSSDAPSAHAEQAIHVYEFNTSIHQGVEITDCVPIPCTSGETVRRANIPLYINSISNIQLTKVADDVWFGPEFVNGWDDGSGEVFIHTSAVTRKQGNLCLKDSNATSVKMQEVSKMKRGTMYEIDLDLSQIKAYSATSVGKTVTTVKSSNVSVTEKSFDINYFTVANNNAYLVDNTTIDEFDVTVSNGISHVAVDSSKVHYASINKVEMSNSRVDIRFNETRVSCVTSDSVTGKYINTHGDGIGLLNTTVVTTEPSDPVSENYDVAYLIPDEESFEYIDKLT